MEISTAKQFAQAVQNDGVFTVGYGLGIKGDGHRAELRLRRCAGCSDGNPGWRLVEAAHVFGVAVEANADPARRPDLKGGLSCTSGWRRIALLVDLLPLIRSPKKTAERQAATIPRSRWSTMGTSDGSSPWISQLRCLTRSRGRRAAAAQFSRNAARRGRVEQRRDEARAARRVRPRCDARDHRVMTVIRANDGLLALCDECRGDVDLDGARQPEAARAPGQPCRRA